MPRALVVRGGWSGHSPIEATNLFVPFLEASGFHVDISDSPAVYGDSEVMGSTDLLVQCLTLGEIARPEVEGLMSAVRSGMGLVGWHGGIIDSYRNAPLYAQLVGGQFIVHPALESGDTAILHTIRFTDAAAEHPITRGLADFDLTTEQYWVQHDDLIDLLATTTHEVRENSAWARPVTTPAVWTRQWGAGRVVVAAPGHDLDTLRHPTVRTIIERGMLWASRPA